MNNGQVVLAQESTSTVVRLSQWLDNQSRGSDRWRIADYAGVHGLSKPLWLVLAVRNDKPGALHFFALTEDSSGPDLRNAMPLRLYQCEALKRIGTGCPIQTEQGNYIVTDANAGWKFDAADIAVPDQGSSTNHVCRLQLGEVVAMHKTYRQVTPDCFDIEASRCFECTPDAFVTRHLGGYRLVGSNHVPYDLGLLTEYFPGWPLSATLSTNLRSLWLALRNRADDAWTSSDLRELIPQHVAGLVTEVSQWRTFLTRFHRHFDQIVHSKAAGAAPAFDFAAHHAVVRARLSRVRSNVRADDMLPRQGRDSIDRILAAIESRYFSRAVSLPDQPASACHGDLHLSHLLACEQGGRKLKRLIDLSPLALHSGAAEFRRSSHWLDWAALARALEYFCLDELAMVCAMYRNCSQEEAMLHLLLNRLETTCRVPISTGPAAEAVRIRTVALSQWHTRVLQALCTATAADDWLQFYIARLLHELDYNYSHDRPYYRCLDFFYLIERFRHLCEA
jgi:1-epi-valienol-7-phosphate kinase